MFIFLCVAWWYRASTVPVRVRFRKSREKAPASFLGGARNAKAGVAHRASGKARRNVRVAPLAGSANRLPSWAWRASFASASAWRELDCASYARCAHSPASLALCCQRLCSVPASRRSAPFSPCGHYLAFSTRSGGLRVMRTRAHGEWDERAVDETFRIDEDEEIPYHACRFSHVPTTAEVACEFVANGYTLGSVVLRRPETETSTTPTCGDMVALLRRMYTNFLSSRKLYASSPSPGS